MPAHFPDKLRLQSACSSRRSRSQSAGLYFLGTPCGIIVNDRRSKRYHRKMSQAYRVVFECLKGGHNISLQRKCPKPSLSEAEAKQIFGNEEIFCAHPNCGWSGKACKTKLLRILPFNWIFSPTT